jgi:glycosyltransferase involved in cell wall biosynthesis
MKKIVRIITRLCVGGPSIHTTLLSGHFNKEGWESKLYVGSLADKEGDMSYLAKEYNVDTIYIEGLGREISIIDDIKAIYNIYKFLKKEKPDIVHTHLAKAGTIGRIAAWLAGVPQIYHTFHGHLFKGYFSPLKTYFFILIERLLALISTRIVTISDLLKNDLVRYKITRADKITVIPLGFDFSRIIPDEEHCQSLRHHLNIPDNKVIVSIIGRLCSIKNHKMFLDIARSVKAKTDNVHFLVIGDGELRSELELYTDDLDIRSCVTFTGFISDLKLVYGSVDIVVLTSLNEGTPVSLLEAMVCKRLVISTNVGGVSDFIKNGESGFCFDFNNEDFVKVIMDYASNPEKYSEIRDQAYNAVIQKYDKQRLFNDIEALYTHKLT